MNVIKVILTIGAILGLVALAAPPTMAQPIEYTGNGQGNSWHTPLNWQGNVVPGATDDVLIPQNHTVVISSADAACKTIDIEIFSLLEVTGKTLTLGISGTPTSSNLDWGGEFPSGTIRFIKSGNDPGILAVHSDVTFTGGEIIDAPTANDAGEIRRASGTGGIIIDDGASGDNQVIGNITLLCDVDNKSNLFGANVGQTMVFGAGNGPADPEPPTISGDGVFFAEGKLQFRIVTFAGTAPKWAVEGGEMEVTDEADDDHWVDVPFDIEMIIKAGGLLHFHHDFSCTGKLTITVGNNETRTITVTPGKIVEFKP